jgi:hypothetical protein
LQLINIQDNSCLSGISHLCGTLAGMVTPKRTGWSRPACSFRSAQAATLLEFMYHSQIVLSVGGCVWYVVRNLRCTVTIESVLANSKTENASLFPVQAMFHHDCPLAVKFASTPRRLLHKKTWRDSLPNNMLPFCLTIPAILRQRSEIPEGLMNCSVF